MSRSEDGTFPRCDDTGTATNSSPPDEVPLAELDGVSPSLMVLRRDDHDSVYVREGVRRSTIPELLEAVRPLTCLPADAPIRFVAEMRGIAPARPGQPFDLAPFDLWIRILESTPPRYERGSVRVRVPESLGRPLTRAQPDALRDGARLSLTIHCLNSGYVADRIVLRRS